MSDLAEVIARLRVFLEDVPHDYIVLFVQATRHDESMMAGELTALLDAAEAAQKARDAALEEAARVAEAVDPEKPGNWLHPRHKIAFAIRALRGAA